RGWAQSRHLGMSRNPTWTGSAHLGALRTPKRSRACEATAEPWSVAAVSERQESKLFAPLGATVSLRTCPGGQTSSGQDRKGAGIVGRWLGTSSLVRAVDAWTLIAILGRWPAARVVRSSPAFCHDH